MSDPPYADLEGVVSLEVVFGKLAERAMATAWCEWTTLEEIALRRDEVARWEGEGGGLGR